VAWLQPRGRTTVPAWHAPAVGREEPRDGKEEAKGQPRDWVAERRAPASKESRQEALSRPSDVGRAESATRLSGGWSPVVERRESPEEERAWPGSEMAVLTSARSAPAHGAMVRLRSAEGTVE
jgi:hypothetical protein